MFPVPHLLPNRCQTKAPAIEMCALIKIRKGETHARTGANGAKLPMRQASQPLLYETIGRCLTYRGNPSRPACPRGSSPKHSLELRRVSTTGRVVSDGACGVGIDRGPVGIWSPNRVEWCLTQLPRPRLAQSWCASIRPTGHMNWNTRLIRSSVRR